eukprot:4608132-Heterocapsa_arctica.AAC.1
MKTYIKYIGNPLVRKDIDSNARIKCKPEGKKGRPCIRPEQLGHAVQDHGEYQSCLGCGRCTKANHVDSAKRAFWNTNPCKPIARYNKHLDNGHVDKFDD